jgi:hypothetical protein
MSHLHYLPLAPGFFAILVGFFLLVLVDADLPCPSNANCGSKVG